MVRRTAHHARTPMWSRTSGAVRVCVVNSQAASTPAAASAAPRRSCRCGAAARERASSQPAISSGSSASVQASPVWITRLGTAATPAAAARASPREADHAVRASA